MIDLIPERYKLLVGGIAIAGALASAGFVGWQVKGMQSDAEIANLQASYAREKAQQATEALASLKGDAEAIHKAATEYAAIETTLAPKIAALAKEIRSAKPLPPDCLPTPDRVRNLDAAIDAANQSIPR